MTLQTLVAAVGLAVFFEGALFALAPSRLTEIVQLISRMPLGRRRVIGLIMMAFGVLVCAAAG